MSASADLVIRGGIVVSADNAFRADVAIKDGAIAAVGAPDAMPAAKETLDATGLHVLPGAIDVHVHFRDPGYPHKEDWASGTAAAAFGGVTTVFDMPNTIPATGNAEILAAKHRIASEKAHVDYGLYGLLGEDTIANVPELIDGGVIGFKLYMGNTFGKIPSPSTGGMLECFEVVAPTGKRIGLHAETNSIMERRQTRLTAAGRTDPLAHLASRPAVVAVEAVSRACILSEWTGARIHILHISSADELRPLREAKARGVEVTGETCPQYLMLSADDYARFSGVIRVNPPVREKSNQDPIWAALHRRHRRHDRDRSRAAYAGGKDAQRHLVGRLRLSRRRDADAGDADRGECRAHVDFGLCALVVVQSGASDGGFIRARARSSPAPTPISPSSISAAAGPSTTPRRSRARRFHPGTAAR